MILNNTKLSVLFLIALFIFLLTLILILNLTPPISRDALTHHLAIPKLYLNHGKIYEIPTMVFSYYPMNVDLLYLIPLYFGNDIIPKLIHFSFALFTAFLIFQYLKKRVNTQLALLGMILFLSIPIIVKLSITAYVDLGLTFFLTASLLSFLKWIEKNHQLKWLITSAVFCGLACGTKYNGLIGLFLLALFVPFFFSRNSKDKNYQFLKSITYGCVFLMIALLIFSPWLLRNSIWTNNPVFPLFDHVFNNESSYSGSEMGIFVYRAVVYEESIWEMLLLPIRIFFQGLDNNPQYFDGRLNPFLLVFIPFAWIKRSERSEHLNKERNILFSFTVLFFIIVIFTRDLRIRYIAPIIPPLIILSTVGLKKLFDVLNNAQFLHSKRLIQAARLIICLFILISFSLNGIYLYEQYRYVKPIKYLRGKISRDQYIEKYRPEYPVMKYINSKLPHDAYILFIFLGNRGYYCDRKYVFDRQGTKSTVQEIIKQSDNSENVMLEFKKKGITHLLVNNRIFNKWQKRSFLSNEQKIIKSFMKQYSELTFSLNGFAVYHLIH